MAVLDDSKLGIDGTDGNGEGFCCVLKVCTTSFLVGRIKGAETANPEAPLLSQEDTNHGQSHLRLFSSKANPKGHLNS